MAKQSPRRSPHLSNEINDAFEAAEGKRFIQISAQKKGTIIEVRTQNSTYTFVVLDPAQKQVAMESTNPTIEKGKIWVISGTGLGGSITEIGIIRVDGFLKMQKLYGDPIGETETSRIMSFSVLKRNPKNTEAATKILAGTETRRIIPGNPEKKRILLPGSRSKKKIH
jgi:hypothetical protein